MRIVYSHISLYYEQLVTCMCMCMCAYVRVCVHTCGCYMRTYIALIIRCVHNVINNNYIIFIMSCTEVCLHYVRTKNGGTVQSCNDADQMNDVNFVVRQHPARGLCVPLHRVEWTRDARSDFPYTKCTTAPRAALLDSTQTVCDAFDNNFKNCLLLYRRTRSLLKMIYLR